MKKFDFTYRDYRTMWDADLSDYAYFKWMSGFSIPILEFLVGQPWDEYALALVLAQNPSCIRVTTGGQSCDARTDRITIVATEEGIIEYIEMELGVHVPSNMEDGHDMEMHMLKIMKKGRFE